MEEVKEKKEEKKEDLQPKNSLSIDGWATIVCSEINRTEEQKSYLLTLFFIAITITFATFTAIIYLVSENKYSPIINLIAATILFLILRKVDKDITHDMEIIKKHSKVIEGIRDYIIITESPDPEVIRKKLEDYEASLTKNTK